MNVNRIFTKWSFPWGGLSSCFIILIYKDAKYCKLKMYYQQLLRQI